MVTTLTSIELSKLDLKCVRVYMVKNNTDVILYDLRLMVTVVNVARGVNVHLIWQRMV